MKSEDLSIDTKNLIELCVGGLNHVIINISITNNREVLNIEKYKHSMIFLGKFSYYVLRGIPDKTEFEINFNFKNDLNPSTAMQSIHLVYSKEFKFTELLNKNNDSVGFYGRFKLSNKKSNYVLEDWKFGVYSPNVV